MTTEQPGEFGDLGDRLRDFLGAGSDGNDHEALIAEVDALLRVKNYAGARSRIVILLGDPHTPAPIRVRALGAYADSKLNESGDHPDAKAQASALINLIEAFNILTGFPASQRDAQQVLAIGTAVVQLHILQANLVSAESHLGRLVGALRGTPLDQQPAVATALNKLKGEVETLRASLFTRDRANGHGSSS